MSLTEIKQDKPWRATVLTLLPDMFPGPLGHSLVGQARANGVWSLDVRDIREHGIGRHRSVDDTPAGGGPGMVMRCDVAAAVIDAAVARAGADASEIPLIYPSPRGEPFTQGLARELSVGPGVIFLAGRFEGLDDRVIAGRNLREVSLGDFVMTGGELAAMAMIDAAVRLLPGVLGAEASTQDESFSDGLLEYPQYTRPRDWEGRAIPDVLLSGNHDLIARWRRTEARRLTEARRPDLIARLARSDKDDH
ncbi:MAG: tRNA (guanosine(37)-N1)-methyltransferase TrmD [Pseudomonadota bacterium]